MMRVCVILATLVAATAADSAHAQLFRRRAMPSRSSYHVTKKVYVRKKADDRDAVDRFAEEQIGKAHNTKRYTDIVESLGLQAENGTPPYAGPYAEQGSTVYGSSAYAAAGATVDQLAGFGRLDPQALFADASRLAAQSIESGSAASAQFMALVEAMGAAAANVASIEAQGEAAAKLVANIQTEFAGAVGASAGVKPSPTPPPGPPRPAPPPPISEGGESPAPVFVPDAAHQCNLCHAEKGKPLVAGLDPGEATRRILSDGEARMPPEGGLSPEDKLSLIRYFQSRAEK